MSSAATATATSTAGAVEFGISFLLAGLGSMATAQAVAASQHHKHPAGASPAEVAQDKQEAKDLLIGYSMEAGFMLLGAAVLMVSGGVTSGY
jgi:hypothetical protein